MITYLEVSVSNGNWAIGISVSATVCNGAHVCYIDVEDILAKQGADSYAKAEGPTGLEGHSHTV